MKMYFYRISIFCVVVLLLYVLLQYTRYMRCETIAIPGGEYAISLHRDRFYFGFAPGGGSDMRGFCCVYSIKGKAEPAYYYLEMVQFVNDVEEDSISVKDDAIQVQEPTFLPLRENFMRLLSFLY